MNELIVNKALEIATEAHAGQTRWNGSPYIEHPKAVMKIALELIKNDAFLDEYDTEIAVSCILHDAGEDSVKWKNKEKELVYFLGESVPTQYFHDGMVVTTLETLNKNNFDHYFDYIIGCSCDSLARIVKMADLTHNLLDAKPGSLRDKYMLALHILERAG